MVALPICVPWDGSLYVQLSTVLSTSKFTAEWDFLRGPLFPAMIKVCFRLFGTHAMTMVALNSALGYLGAWLLGNAVKRQGFPRAGGVIMLLLCLYPILLTYQHTLLSDAGIFCCVAAMFNAAAWQTPDRGRKSAVLIAVITISYYFRPNLIYLGPVLAGVYLIEMCANAAPCAWRQIVRGLTKRAILHGALVLAAPFILAMPWKYLAAQQNPLAMQQRQADVFAVGLFNQLVIHPEDEIVGPSLAPAFQQVIDRALVNGHLPLDGLGGGSQNISAQRSSHFLSGWDFIRQVRLHPVRYAKGVGRTVLLFCGLPGHNCVENKLFLSLVTPTAANAPSMIFMLPPSIDAEWREKLAQRTGVSEINRVVALLDPVYDVLVFIGMLMTFAGFFVGLYRGDWRLLSVTAPALAFIGMYALVLLSADRYAFPVYAIALANLIYVPILIWGGGKLPVQTNRELDSSAIKPMIFCLIGFCIVHAIYLLLSSWVPVADEPHYMRGAWTIAKGASDGLGGLWRGYTEALGFKAPLVCVLPALFSLMVGHVIECSMFSLWLTYAGLLLAAYSFFRNAFSKSMALYATVLLGAMPLITSLTHRFYVETQFLMLTLIFFDILIRHEWDSYGWSILAGVVLGMGVLCKITAAIIWFLPALVLWGIQAHKFYSQRVPLRVWLSFGAHTLAMLLCAFAVAWTWYGYNWQYLVAHLSTSLTAVYPSVIFFLVNISSGPHLFLTIVALFGIVPLYRMFASGQLYGRARLAWLTLIVLFAATFLITTMSPAKCTRYAITILPVFAALGAIVPVQYFSKSLRAAYVILGVCVLLFLNDSFGLLPTVRIGDLRIVDCKYPLSQPDFAPDALPLDRRDFKIDELEQFMADDARKNYGSQRADVVVTVNSRFPHHDYLNLLSAVKNHTVDFHPAFEGGFLISETQLAPNPNRYLLHATGLEAVDSKPGLILYRPTLDEEIADKKWPYDRIAAFDVPEGVRYYVYRLQASFVPH